MKMNNQQMEILDWIESNSCTEVGTDDAFLRSLQACISPEEIDQTLQSLAYYLNLLDTYNSNKPVTEWYPNA